MALIHHQFIIKLKYNPKQSQSKNVITLNLSKNNSDKDNGLLNPSSNNSLLNLQILFLYPNSILYLKFNGILKVNLFAGLLFSILFL